MNPRDDKDALFQGRTEATLESIALSLDDLRKRLDGRPCRQHGQDITANSVKLYLIGALYATNLGAMIWLALKLVDLAGEVGQLAQTVD